ncbi:MAG TPA: ATP-binding protein [Thermoanaerobaculia bacterium]|nr:ATP-binding protein [Thermoanaerobaculia bacterium]
MATEPHNPAPDPIPDLDAPRVLTDESLQQERSLADQAIAEGMTEAAAKTVATVEEVRAQTDESLQRERVEADLAIEDVRQEAAERVEQTLAEEVPEAAQVGEVIAQERQLADEAVREERERANELLRLERERADAALERERRERLELQERLLERERRQTDGNLAHERDRADEAVGQLAARAGSVRHEPVVTRDEILAIVSHDLRDPLHTIALSADLMRENAPPGESGGLVRGLAGTVQRCVGQMTTLIGDLLDLERIASGRLRMDPEPRDAVAVAREAVERARPAAIAKGITLQAELPPGQLVARFDRDRILQVFANLLGNAVKFTPEGGRVWVEAERVDGVARFAVRDTGPGIPEEEREGIFDRFTQLDRESRGGLGLGLYISRWIVEQHGGTIQVESEVGAGSTFSFTLPLA